MGFYGEDEIPKPPYACWGCRKVFGRCEVEDTVVHIKMSGKLKGESGFFKTWTLKCPDPHCGHFIRTLELVKRFEPTF